MIAKGFRFGMLLQLAIGPVCLFIFKVGGNAGIINALSAVMGVALIDGLYILLAVLGVAAFISNPKVECLFAVLGALVVGFVGLETILDALGMPLLQGLVLFDPIKPAGSFWGGAVLTASNPLTILFWAGVFSNKIAFEQLNGKEISCFGLGCVLSTLLFLTLTAFIGSLTRHFISPNIVSVLNIIVGLALIYFAYTMLMRRSKVS